MESENPQRDGAHNYYFQGAKIGHFVINSGNMARSNDSYYHEKQKEDTSVFIDYSDEQVARALTNIVGKGKPIDAKKKWAGAIWFLQWACHYPANTKEACDRINSLPFSEQLEYECDYSNVRALTTLSFFNEDARYLDNVRYSKNDEGAFRDLKKVVVALGDELQKQDYQEMKLANR